MWNNASLSSGIKGYGIYILFSGCDNFYLALFIEGEGQITLDRCKIGQQQGYCGRIAEARFDRIEYVAEIWRVQT